MHHFIILSAYFCLRLDRLIELGRQASLAFYYWNKCRLLVFLNVNIKVHVHTLSIHTAVRIDDVRECSFLFSLLIQLLTGFGGVVTVAALIAVNGVIVAIRIREVEIHSRVSDHLFLIVCRCLLFRSQ